jgi:hypothetical protein
MKIYRLIIIILTLQTQISIGQNTIWLTNGKQLKVGDYKFENQELISYKNHKNKVKTIEAYDVFSIIEASGSEKVIYVCDTIYQGAFSVIEMRSFVQGQTDANQKFKSPWTTVGGIAVAGASSMVINPVYVFLLSGAYCSTIGVTNKSIKKMNIPSEYINNEPYILGYKKASKHKRIKNSIIGSTIGLAVGLGTFAIINKK